MDEADEPGLRQAEDLPEFLRDEADATAEAFREWAEAEGEADEQDESDLPEMLRAERDATRDSFENLLEHVESNDE